MGNQNSSGQTFRFILLFIACFFLTKSFFNPPKPSGPPRAVPTLQAAFSGIDTPDKISNSAATAEIAKLDKAIGGFTPQAAPGFIARLFGGGNSNPNASDEYSYWARLRAGLIQQYALRDSDKALQMYDQIGARTANDVYHAQALYQKGDLLWHLSKVGELRRQTAASTLELLIHAGRGSSKYLDHKIYVPRPAPGTTQNPAQAVVQPRNFELVRVGDLRNADNLKDGEGIPNRVDQYYATTTFHQIFDEVVKLFGNRPQYSYGLALLFFAVFLRIILQPVTKKQYASMKGMADVAPEIKKIQEKYKDKPDKQMDMLRETRELYKAHGTNPQLGCMLGLIQLPIFLWVVYPLIQHYEAKMDLVGASFLWIESLSRPDIPLLIIYALSQFLSFRLSATPPTDPQQAQIQVMMSFIMPLTIPLFLWTYPSAFVLYWTMFNLISTIFQWRMMKASDPDKRIMQTLLSNPLAGLRAAPADGISSKDALPSRPSSSTRSSEKGFNGARNGKSNGAVLKTVSTKELQEMNGNTFDETSVATLEKRAANAKESAARRKRRRRR